MTGKEQRRRVPVVGLAVAACVACCAAPILALIGGAGLVAAVSTWAVGAVGEAVLITGVTVALLAMVWRRRRRQATGLIQIERPRPIRR